MSPTTPYYASGSASARFYDLVTAADPWLAGDIDIYAGLVSPGSPILELGAGTGRVAIALAERGHRVTGLDLAAEMLAAAERKRMNLPPAVAERLNFVRGDLTVLALPQRFDAILVTYFTLAHLPPDRWRKAFAGIARHLLPGGIVAVHLPVAELMASAPPPPDRPVLRQAAGPDEVLTLYVAGKDLRPGRMTLSLDYVVRSSAGALRSRSRESLTYYDADPAPYAERAGLRSAGAPIPLGKTGFIHRFLRPSDGEGNGADDGT